MINNIEADHLSIFISVYLNYSSGNITQEFSFSQHSQVSTLKSPLLKRLKTSLHTQEYWVNFAN